MPTYTQLNAEPVWRTQFAPPALAALEHRLEARGITCYIAGDNKHLRGRHRSRDWCEQSRYCTNRTYGTRDSRDRRGDGRWYRAIDVMLAGRPLWDACRRIDTAVRAGRLPGLAEWFGTFNGRTVVGWFEGREGSSDTSHLTHLHVGVWTESADDAATMDLLFSLITGVEDDMTPQESAEAWVNAWRTYGLQNMQDPIVIPANPGRGLKTELREPNLLARAIKAIGWDPSPEDLSAIAAAAKAGAESGSPTTEELEQAAFEGAQRAERE